MEELAFQLVIMAVFGAIVGAIAHSRDRNPVGWFFIGAFFNCFALILVLVLPDLKLEEQRRDRLRRDNVRLRERIQKERQIADQRHEAALKRLGAHDAVLGVDTVDPADRPPELSEGRRKPRLKTSSRWHYAATEDAGTQGPISLDALRDLWDDGAINRDSLVWTKGMDDWLAIGQVPELLEEFELG